MASQFSDVYETISEFIQSVDTTVGFQTYRICEPYDLCSNFSNLSMKLVPAYPQSQPSRVSVSSLFELSLLELQAKEGSSSIQPLLQMLSNLDAYAFETPTNAKENQVMYKISDVIIQHLCEEVILNVNDYGGLVHSGRRTTPSTKVRASTIGIGESETWHGYPDARIRAGYNSDGSEVTVSISGDTVLVEAKRSLRAMTSQLPQVVGQSVVSSFLEHNLHPNLNSLVPAIMLCESHLLIVLYDCVKDYLLLSNYIEFAAVSTDSETQGMKVIIPKSSGIIFLWLAINHRIYLNVPVLSDDEKSSFLTFLAKYEAVQTLLKNTRNKRRNQFSSTPPVCRDLPAHVRPVTTFRPPPLKKSKTT